MDYSNAITPFLLIKNITDENDKAYDYRSAKGEYKYEKILFFLSYVKNYIVCIQLNCYVRKYVALTQR